MKSIFTKAGKESQKGLSLIEVLVTIAVLAVVASISLPILTNVIQRAQIDAHKAEMLLTADTIKNAIAGMSGVRPDDGLGLALGQGTEETAVRYNANQDVRFRFDRQSPNSFYTVTPSRVTRLVSVGSGTQNDPYTGFCMTAWVGDVNLELRSNSTEVLEIAPLTGNPCGLIPGPIDVPDAPQFSDGGIQILNNTIATVAFTPPSNPGGEDWTGLEIINYRATCESEDGGVARTATAASSPITVTGLSEDKTYSCTIAALNNGDPNWSEESNPTIFFEMPTPPLSVIPAPIPTGVNLNVSWNFRVDAQNNTAMYNFDPSLPEYGGRMTIDNYAIYYLENPVGGLTDTTVIPAEAIEVRTDSVAASFVLDSSRVSPGKSYHVWIRALNNAGPVPSWSTTQDNYVGYGDIAYAGLAQTGTEPDEITNTVTFLEGTTDRNQEISFTWNTGPTTSYYNGGLPILRYEYEYDFDTTFDSGTNGAALGSGTKQPVDNSLPIQELNISGLPVGTTYFLRMKACNQIGCSDWGTTTSGATSDVAAPPGSASATVSPDGTGTVTWN
jgi:prepilin-type N-terminal cleavage/methylation domain-containing protein